MQEPKHSPAPWNARTIFGGSDKEIFDNEDNFVAYIKHNEDNFYDLPLILYAPEILQALITTSSNLASLAAACNCNDYDEWKKMIDNVIAKALGEE